MNTVKEKARNKRSRITPENKEVKKVLDFQSVLFKNILDEVKMGGEMITHNIDTEFTGFLKAVINEPVDFIFANFQTHAQFLITALNEMVVKFLGTHKSIIKKVYRADNSLTYHILLKKDSASNRYKLLEFLIGYESTPISRNFNIKFNFIPVELENEASALGIQVNLA